MWRSGRINLVKAPPVQLFQSRIRTALRNLSSTASSSNIQFPWREGPHPVERTFKNRIRFNMTKYLTGSVFSSYGEFLHGAETSFKCAVNAIFHNKKLSTQLIPMTHETIHDSMDPPPTKSGKDTSVREDVMDLSEVFEEGLSEYYQQAIDQFVTNHPDCLIGYQLLNINKVKFLAGKPVVYSSVFVQHHDELVSYGEKVFTNLEPSKWLEHYDEDPVPDRILLRMWVEIDCQELFYIQHKATQEIVQGSLLPTTRKHHVLLEGSISVALSKAPKLLSSWKLVDLDHWLEGCDFGFTRKRLK